MHLRGDDHWGIRIQDRDVVGDRRDVTVRRCRYELRQARARLHILDGYLIALDRLDEVIALIRASRTPDDARVGLVATFGLSEIQAQAILDMRLQRLTGMERLKIEEEAREVRSQIEWFESILADAGKLMGLVRKELEDIKQRFGDVRRTRIVEDHGGRVDVSRAREGGAAFTVVLPVAGEPAP